MQRLKQRNLGMTLRLATGEFLVAQGPMLPIGHTLHRERIRVELSGYAERSIHEIGPNFSTFSHNNVQLDEATLAAILASLRNIRTTLDCVISEAVANGTYRMIEYRDGKETTCLRVEYVFGVASPPAPEFDSTWQLLQKLFQVSA